MSNESKIYTEKDMIKAARYGYEYHQDSQFPHLKFDEMAVNNFRQLLESNKLGEDSDIEKFHIGDIMTTDLELDYPQYYVKAEYYQSLQSERDKYKLDYENEVLNSQSLQRYWGYEKDTVKELKAERDRLMEAGNKLLLLIQDHRQSGEPIRGIRSVGIISNWQALTAKEVSDGE